MNNKFKELTSSFNKDILAKGHELYVNNAVKKFFEIKEDVYRAVIQIDSLESKVSISLKDNVINCDCHSFRLNNNCIHTAAALYALKDIDVSKKSVLINESVDQMVYSCSNELAFEYLMHECRNSHYHREFFKFLFYILKDRVLTEYDYQYLFDYTYSLTDSLERVKTIERLNDCLFDRCKRLLGNKKYEEALVVLKVIINNDHAMNKNISDVELGHYENHFTQTAVFVKSTLHLIGIFINEFDKKARSILNEVFIGIFNHPIIYVGVYHEVKAILLDEEIKDSKLINGLIELQNHLSGCSDICKDITVELIFKHLAKKDDYYDYFRAVYCNILFNRAYTPGNLNIELIDEIRILIGKDYVSQVNRLAKYQGEKNNQKQLFDICVHDNNYRDLAKHAFDYSNLRYIDLYARNIEAVVGNGFEKSLSRALSDYIAEFRKANDSFIQYILIYEFDIHFYRLLSHIKSSELFEKLKSQVIGYEEEKMALINNKTLINRNIYKR